MSGEQAEERTAREIRKATDWLENSEHTVSVYEKGDVSELLTEYASAECSRLASSRVEELENLIAKHSECSRCADSASGSTSNHTAKETR